LCAGDTVALVAPARKISLEEVRPAIQWLQSAGFKVKQGKHLFAEANQYAGSDKQRANDMQEMIDSEEVKAILCARGGYGTVRVIDKINFSPLRENPKWLCGYSDITALHAHLYSHLHLATIHSTMPLNITSSIIQTPTCTTLLDALTGQNLMYSFPAHPCNRSGEATGTLVGGNLSVLYSILGSSSDFHTDNTILFLEDTDEYLYHIDRMMVNFKRTGKLSRLAGLVVGGMSRMNDNSIAFGKNAQEIIAEHCRDYSFPLCFNLPVGHQPDNRALRLGTPASLVVNENNSTLIMNP
jgi:muramoyltetrapeptide carboxypeptidase